MSVLSALIGSDNPVATIVGKIADKALSYIPDPEQRAKAEQELRQLDLNADIQQINTNIEEAKSEKWWKAGWRPFIGWTCGMAYAYHFVLQPFLEVFIRLWIPNFTGPTIDISELGALLFGMLGLGYYRTREKENLR